jgi:hypothetical protein
MGKRAVYNNQHLAIYITGEDLDTLLDGLYIYVGFFIGKTQIAFHPVQVVISGQTAITIRRARKEERKAVEEIQDQFAKDHPNYESSTTTQTRSKRARKRLR